MAKPRLKALKAVTFDELSHRYFLNDEKLLIGVTSLMSKHGLSANYGSIDQETLNAAAARGTAVHEMLEDYDNGKNVITSDVLYNGKCVITSEQMQSNLNAYKKLGLPVLCSEYLVSDSKVVASFIDKVFDDFSIADVKTTSSLHKGALEWQLSIYAFLFELINPSKKVPHLYAIHVRDGKAKLVEVNRLPDEKVAALLAAEAEGSIYFDNPEEDTTPSITQFMSADMAAFVAESELRILEYKQYLDEVKAQVKEAEETIHQYMVDNNLDALAFDGGVIKRKKESSRETFDTKKFKEDHPELADKYIKVSSVKGSISFVKQ